MLAEIPAMLAQQGGGAESTSLIDWVTLIAQMANFLLLVILLRIFLYGPVVRAMDQRAKKIASHFEAADQKERDAADRADALQREKDELEQNREAMLAEARQQADARRLELTQKARQDVQVQGDRWREDLQRGKDAFLQEIRDTAAREVCAIARQALAELADAQLERSMVTVLVRRLEELPPDGRRELTDAVAGDEQGLVIATAWDLPEPDRDTAADAVRKYLTADAEIRFETAKELTCGIELRAGGRAISWTVESYIEGIREQLSQAVDRTVAAESQRADAEKAAAEEQEHAEQESSNE